MTNSIEPPEYQESRLRRALPVLLPFSLVVLLALLWFVLMRLYPPSTPPIGVPPEEIKFTVAGMEPPGGPAAEYQPALSLLNWSRTLEPAGREARL